MRIVENHGGKGHGATVVRRGVLFAPKNLLTSDV